MTTILFDGKTYDVENGSELRTRVRNLKRTGSRVGYRGVGNYLQATVDLETELNRRACNQGLFVEYDGTIYFRNQGTDPTEERLQLSLLRDIAIIEAITIVDNLTRTVSEEVCGLKMKLATWATRFKIA